MSIKAALFNYLDGYGGLGSVYPDWLPQSPSYPAVTYNRSSVRRDVSMCATNTHVRSRFRVDSWAKTYKAAEVQAEVLRAALIDFRGTWGGSPGVQIDKVFIENEFDISDPEPGLHRVQLDVTVWHYE